MDGFGTPEQHVARAVELGMSALALTEHGNVSSHVRLEKAATAAGIKPIFGCELYTAPDRVRQKWHLGVLAMDQEGYRNLNRIVSRAWAEGFYQWPTASSAMLMEHSEGLVVLSGCADSLLSCTLLGGKSNGPRRDSASSEDMDNAERVIRNFKEIFGDRYYLEVQRFPGLQRTRTLNPVVAELSRRTGVPLVATADCHYPRPSDNEMQKILHAAGRGTGSVAAAEASWEYDILLTPPTSDTEVYKALIGTGLSKAEARAAILATGEIAARCTVTLPKSEQLRFPLEPGQTAQSLIWDWLRDGWRYRWNRNARMRANKRQYVERLNYEMQLLTDKDFLDYFLMLSEAVRWTKDQGIGVGPARGSAAASLTCYLLRITEVDPLQFPTMVFERFIDATRKDLPDVDLDFSDDRRHEVVQHMRDMWGKERVGNIGNFTRYRGKNSIDDVARVYEIPKWEAETVKGLIIERSGGDSRISDSLEDTFHMFPKAAAVLERFPQLANSIRLEGNFRGMSVHAAGVVVSNRPITDFCAVYTRESGGTTKQVLAYDKKDAEYLGMLKADFLGLTTMGMIDRALEMIGMTLDELYAIPLDDPDTLAAFKRNDVVGIFQFEGRATRVVCADVSPDNFMHLADINALSRPGPLFSGMTAQYVDVKHGRKPIEKLHPIVDKVTEWSYGQIVYQEQVLTIIKEMGGFPVTKIADIRKIISQKLGEMSFQKMQEEFLSGALRLHGVKHDLALRIWNFMVTSATYSFNVAHCVSYSMLAFWQMWIKVHHPLAFYAASLAKLGDGKKEREYKRPRLLADAVKHGVKVLPPDLVVSDKTWVADPKARAVRAGFTQIDGIGPATWKAIAAAREERPFEDWADLIRVKGIGPKTILKIRAFCENEDPFDLDLVARVLGEFRKGIENGDDDYVGLPEPTHTSDQIPRQGEHTVTWMGLVRSINYQNFVENRRTRTGDSEEKIIAEMKDPHLVDSCVLRCYDDGEEDVYVRFNRWQFPRFKEALEDLQINQHVIIATGHKREDFGISIHASSMVVIDPEPDDEEEE